MLLPSSLRTDRSLTLLTPLDLAVTVVRTSTGSEVEDHPDLYKCNHKEGEGGHGGFEIPWADRMAVYARADLYPADVNGPASKKIGCRPGAGGTSGPGCGSRRKTQARWEVHWG